MNNVIENLDNDSVMGLYPDIVRCFKDRIKEDVNNEEFDTIEDMVVLLKDLQKDYDNGVLGDEDLLEVSYNPMGAYCYCKWNREEE